MTDRVGVSELLDGITPWLIELGNWIFGGLIGFNVVVLGAVLTIVPVDNAVKIASAASAVALPPSAVGLVMLRLLADVRSIRQSPAAARALEPVPDADGQAAARRRNVVVRRYAYLLMLLSVLLTLVAVTAALWHLVWWIGAAFLVALAGSVATVILAAAQLAIVGRRPGSGSSTQP